MFPANNGGAEGRRAVLGPWFGPEARRTSGRRPDCFGRPHSGTICKIQRASGALRRRSSTHSPNGRSPRRRRDRQKFILEISPVLRVSWHGCQAVPGIRRTSTRIDGQRVPKADGAFGFRAWMASFAGDLISIDLGGSQVSAWHAALLWVSRTNFSYRRRCGRF